MATTQAGVVSAAVAYTRKYGGRRATVHNRTGAGKLIVEGTATLVGCKLVDVLHDMSLWRVQFVGGDCVVERWIFDGDIEQ